MCALEAFINQIAFFVVEVDESEPLNIRGIPIALMKDRLAFQRTTELTTKWDILGKALCGAAWPPPAVLWTDFKNLVTIRNEFVHFKVSDYEQIVPPPKKQHPILNLLPRNLQIRKTDHSWPFKALNAETAKWAVDVAEQMIAAFKRGYAESRKREK